MSKLYGVVTCDNICGIIVNEVLDGDLYVRYTGSIKDVDLDTFGLTSAFLAPGYIDFDLTASPDKSEGRLYWNESHGTLEVGMPGGNLNLQLGQENLVRVKNGSGSTILKGKAVYVNGADGVRPTIGLADATNHVVARATIAITTEEILNNQLGYVTSFGMVRNMNTDVVSADGMPVFLSTTPGDLSASLPTQPNTQVFMGVVLRKHATEGVLFVKIIPQPNLDELSDVLVSSVANNELLVYDSTSTTWNNTSSLALTGLSVSGYSYLNLTAGIDNSVVVQDADGSLRIDEIDGRVWGTGLIGGTMLEGYIPFGDNSNTLQYDYRQLFWDKNSNQLGLGTNSPNAQLHVEVDAYIGSTFTLSKGFWTADPKHVNHFGGSLAYGRLTPSVEGRAPLHMFQMQEAEPERRWRNIQFLEGYYTEEEMYPTIALHGGRDNRGERRRTDENFGLGQITFGGYNEGLYPLGASIKSKMIGDMDEFFLESDLRFYVACTRELNLLMDMTARHNTLYKDIFLNDTTNGNYNDIIVRDNGGMLYKRAVNTDVWNTAKNFVDATSGVNNRLATFTDSDSIQGEANLTYDGTTFTVTANTNLNGRVTLSNVDVGVTDSVLTRGLGNATERRDINPQVWNTSETWVKTTGTPVDNQIGIFTGANTVEGVTGLTYNGTVFNVTGNITLSGTVDGIDIATDVAANTAKDTNATHTGEVTGSTALIIADNIVDEANMKISNTPTNDHVLTADSAVTGGMKWAAAGGSGDLWSDPVDSDIISDGTPRDIGNLTNYFNNIYSQNSYSAVYAHKGDSHTLMGFNSDELYLQAGGVRFLQALKSSNYTLTINQLGGDIDFIVKGNTDDNLLFCDASTDRVGVGTNTPTALLDVNSDILRLRTSKTPASASATGNAGDICWDSSYVYVCVATDTWKRTSIATW